MEPEELRRIVEVNLLGQMHGARAALPHLEARGGGVLVFVSSALGRQGVPLQSAYVATKFGIIGFAESLRMELQHDGTGVQVSTVLPPSVNTPLFDHARSRLGVKGKPVPPVYDPSVVAEAILGAAEHPRREVAVGMAARQLALLGRLPRPLAERVIGADAVGFAQQQRDEPDDGRDNLFEPSFATKARGQFGDFVIGVDPVRRVADGVAAVGGAVGDAVGAVGKVVRR
jgi:short-subunit dehydrogenase